ncbi:hypothetical protein Nepgr_005630 [Nepenthes gracilis]|uniref:BRX domain-containing protein n=1 Tax=Nepenthes gracilis TaxID=150966 RepID=A0AAD3S3N9_NEPGR|nr:hypothetical protein Nepgr_005630 [Nepenthes gracilis]
MLPCLACSKQLNGESLQQQQQVEDDAIATPRTKHAIKNLTTQIKDIVLKASGAYKSCKPCSGRRDNGNHLDSDSGSVSGKLNFPYKRTGSSNSTPRIWGKEMEARLKGLSSGEGTPASVSGRTESIVFIEEDEPKEWIAHVEPGVLITFVSMPQGGNDLKGIRFSRELFNKWQAQRWWAENSDKIIELYNVQRFKQQTVPFPAPSRSKDEGTMIGSAEGSPMTPPLCKERLPRNSHLPTVTADSSSGLLDHQQMQACNGNSHGLASIHKDPNISEAKPKTSSVDASPRSSSLRDEDCSRDPSVSNASDMETEWVEQDEPGVYITIRSLPGGLRELRRIRFSREKFGETQARLWWEENKARIQEQYL